LSVKKIYCKISIFFFKIKKKERNEKEEKKERKKEERNDVGVRLSDTQACPSSLDLIAHRNQLRVGVVPSLGLGFFIYYL
ncbi:MAG: hypothetical protein Q8P67_08620, partial [archaeon]|nr:hypothetical protein [archaeon]